MAETYQFTWGELTIIERAIPLAKLTSDEANYTHIETKDFDLDVDRIGMRITIPHDPVLTEERKPV